MPSNYTPNYSLNQWSAEDRVLRTDFNADNAKIDAAIKAVSQRVDSVSGSKAEQSALTALTSRTALLEDMAKLHTIKTISSPKTTGNVSIVLSDVDWTQWKIVVTCIHVEMDTGSCRLFPRGSTHDTTVLATDTNFEILLFPMHRTDLIFAGLMLGSSGSGFGFGTTYQNATGFALSPLTTQTILSVTATVYGIK